MKLNFIIDKNYLIKHTLNCADKKIFSSNKNKKDIFSFSNYVLKNYPKYYDFMTGIISPEDISEDGVNYFTKTLNKELPLVLGKIKKSKEFEKIYSQTEKYLVRSKKEWEKNLEKTEEYIYKLTKFNLDKEFTIYITHPSQRNGSYWGKNQISWGVSEKWSNYTTVYLWHEILHSYFDNSNTNHVIIELVTDEELRGFLNNTKYPPFEGHKHLSDLKKKILPYWKRYLKKENKSIKEFEKEMAE